MQTLDFAGLDLYHLCKCLKGSLAFMFPPHCSSEHRNLFSSLQSAVSAGICWHADVQ